MRKVQSDLLAKAADENTPINELLSMSKKRVDVEIKRELAKNPSILISKDDSYDTSLMERLAAQFPDDVFFYNPAFVLHAIVERSAYMLGVVGQIASATEDENVMERIFSMYGTDNLVSRNLVTNRKATEALLRAIFQINKSAIVKMQLAISPQTPKDILHYLGNPINRSSNAIMVNVAANTNTEARTLQLLSTQHEEVREQVALNPNTPAHVFEFLGDVYSEKIELVRSAVASNTKTPQGILQRLGDYKTEPSKDVRVEAIRNPSLDRAFLAQISLNDPSEEVRAEAQRIMNE